MILFRYYDENERVDRIWYDSTNLVYSECDDKIDDYKDLKVTFKNGDTYLYKKVDVNDYVLFVHGGTDASNGKAFWKIIRPKYETEKIGRVELSELNEQMEFYKKKKAEILKKKGEKEIEENSGEENSL